MLIGVVAHADGAVGQITEHAAAVLPGDDGGTAAADRVSLLCAVKGVGLGGFYRNLKIVLLRVESGNNAVQLLAGGGTPPAGRGWQCTAAPAGSG